MSAKRICTVTMLLAVLGGSARGQEGRLPVLPPVSTPSTAPLLVAPDHPLVPASPAASDLPPGSVATPYVSPWINYPQGPGCCGPVGGDGPIATELYTRTGIFFRAGGGSAMTQSLNPGLGFQWGGRTLFFNPSGEKAWTIDLGLTYQYFDGRANAPIFQIDIDQGAAPNTTRQTIDVNIRGYHRFAGRVAGGREWYLLGSVYDRNGCQRNWRAGMDLGGSWATTHLDLNDITNTLQFEAPAYERLRDVAGGMFVSLHSDVEVPLGGWLLQTGVRLEWEYQWSDILARAGVGGDLATVNLLWTIGVRF